MKYIALATDDGQVHPVVFSNALNHYDAYNYVRMHVSQQAKPLSAGFVRYNYITHHVYGTSSSLAISADQQDGAVLADTFKRDAYAFILTSEYGDLLLIPLSLKEQADPTLQEVLHGIVHIIGKDRGDDEGILQVIIEVVHAPSDKWKLTPGQERLIKQIVNCGEY